jgi:hypothetical protein
MHVTESLKYLKAAVPYFSLRKGLALALHQLIEIAFLTGSKRANKTSINLYPLQESNLKPRNNMGTDSLYHVFKNKE